MKAASISELKTEMKTLTAPQLMDLCLHLAKYKKENKELLSYLLFEAQNEASYVKDVKEVMDQAFAEVNRHYMFQTKKQIRKILRDTTKHIKYSGKKETEVELLIYFCQKMKKSGIRFDTNVPLTTLYNRQLLKIGKVITQLHEDLQHDFMEEVRSLLD